MKYTTLTALALSGAMRGAPGAEAADERHPFRLVTAPARQFLNSTFSETPTSRRREGTGWRTRRLPAGRLEPRHGWGGGRRGP